VIGDRSLNSCHCAEQCAANVRVTPGGVRSRPAPGVSVPVCGESAAWSRGRYVYVPHPCVPGDGACSWEPVAVARSASSGPVSDSRYPGTVARANCRRDA
jgi:hypothetical protein